MAMIDCPECSHRISDQSISCPSCGFVTNKINTAETDIQVRGNQSVTPQKRKSALGSVSAIITKIILFIVAIVIIIFIFIFISSYSSYKEKSDAYMQTQGNTELDTSSGKIPMLIAGAAEDGRYFLTSHTKENGIEYVEYVRKGNENESYSKMQINCSKNMMKSYSADNTNALGSADMGDWYTPIPDWTDKDIFNFICN